MPGIYSSLYLVLVNEHDGAGIFFWYRDLQTGRGCPPRRPLSIQAWRAGCQGVAMDWAILGLAPCVLLTAPMSSCNSHEHSLPLVHPRRARVAPTRPDQRRHERGHPRETPTEWFAVTAEMAAGRMTTHRLTECGSVALWRVDTALNSLPSKRPPVNPVTVAGKPLARVHVRLGGRYRARHAC